MVPETLQAAEGLDLVEFFISFTWDSEEGDDDLWTSDIISYIQRWPRLRNLCIDNTFDDPYIVDIIHSPANLRGCCSALQDIDISLFYLNTNQLLSLSEMAPNIKRFSAYFEANAMEAFSTCLRTWSSTLTHLSFAIDESTPVHSPSVGPALSGLRALRSLQGHTTHISPDILPNFGVLETLTCTCTPEGLRDLAQVFQEAETRLMPSLRRVALLAAADFLDGDESEVDASFEYRTSIESACADRGIYLLQRFPAMWIMHEHESYLYVIIQPKIDLFQTIWSFQVR